MIDTDRWEGIVTAQNQRSDYVDRVIQRGGEAGERLFWSVERRQAFTNQRLAEFLEFARERSPWHRQRLEHIDLATVDTQDMSALPTMNKQQLHDKWDNIVTDPELTYDVAQRHLSTVKQRGFGFALDRYVVCATGGSTGFRSVIALDIEAFAENVAVNFAHAVTSRAPDAPMPDAPVQGRLMASNAIHMSAAIAAIMQGTAMRVVTVPPSTPIPEAVARLNEEQPDVLVGYGSMLHLMALESLAGRLTIQPLMAANGGEPLLPETRTVVHEAFGIGVRNMYAATEAYLGESWRDSTLLHLADDMTVVELVDADNQLVPPGTPSAKVLITNLANRLQPLIRYEITDEVTEASDGHEAPGPWSGRWIHPPQGRSDDWLRYGGTIVHPHVFRSQLAAAPGVAEYQVTQTASGAHVALVASGDLDTAALRKALTAELVRVGLPNPDIEVETVGRISHHSETGKLRRFIPLP